MIAAVRAGDLYHPSYAAPSGALCRVGMSFVLNTVGLVNAVVTPQGLDTAIWTTPNEPYLLEQAFLELTGPCTASQNPGTPVLKLNINGVDVIGGVMTSWPSLTYAIDGTNLTMWNTRLSGSVFDNFPGAGTGASGAMTQYGVFAAMSAGGAGGFWNKPVNFHVQQGVGNITMKIPFRAILIGRFLGS